MSDNSIPVDPAEVPVFTGDLEILDEKVKALRTDGEKLSDAASDVHVTFGGLSAFYEAPEAEKLFASTLPMVGKADDMHLDVSDVASALGTYSETVRPLKNRLEQLKTEAENFRAMTIEDPDWREDGDKVEENNNRHSEIGRVWGQFQEAEVACHNAIVALVGGDALKMNGKPGQKGYYGYTGDVLSQAAEMPWGKPVEESVPWYQSYEYVGDFAVGIFVDGVWGTIKGLGTLVGVDGWDAAGQAWTGLGKLLTGLVVMAVPGAATATALLPDGKVKDWLNDSQKAVIETGKALIAYDQWDTQPGRAAGATTFNVVTTVLTGGATGAAATAGKAGAIAKGLSLVGKAGRVIDPMTYIGKGVGLSISKIGSALAVIRGVGQVQIPPLPDNAVLLPDGARLLDDGSIYLPDGTPVPRGATELPDGRITAPDDVPVVPEDAIPVTVKDKTTGAESEAFLLNDGRIVDGRMNTIQHADEAPTDIVDQPATRAETPAQQPVLVGAGTRADDAALGARMGVDAGGGDLGTGARGAADAAGGGSRDLGPGHADDLGRGTTGDQPPTSGRGSGHNGDRLNDLHRAGGHGGSGGLDDLGRSGDDAAEGGARTGEDGQNLHSEGHADDGGTPHQPADDNIPPDERDVRQTRGSVAEDVARRAADAVRVGDQPMPPPGPGPKLLGQIPESRLARNADGLITRVDGRNVEHFLKDLSFQRGAAYREARDLGTWPRKQTGACVGAVMDLRTGRVFEGINGKADDFIDPDLVHPTLADRLDSLGDPPPGPDHPLGHAEVKALNELLWERQKMGLPDGPEALADFQAAVESPYGKHLRTELPGRPAPFCVNCRHMMHGVDSLHGKFTGPAQDEYWIP
ncbi:YwqJ-related putative deaminase [Streptomyces indicus]|uniref:YwqJ-like deaminase n=1 Tax=Streptomyces indicus TaxID=417292 RepID=A0A1G9JHP1_9ACTN|nr:YwqJ-related putative deaminase [Streptomyces indicus]SDL36802.1 YwqJ-like deaminase [Streptomyces indicus]